MHREPGSDRHLEHGRIRNTTLDESATAARTNPQASSGSCRTSSASPSSPGSCACVRPAPPPSSTSPAWPGTSECPPAPPNGYLSLLEAAFLIHLVPAWSTNLSSKVVRRPKLFMADSGLAGYMVQATPESLEGPHGPVGQLFETFVVQEVLKQATWSVHRPSLWHFRDRGGAEVDLVLEHPDGPSSGSR